eukprot:8463087-Alexandrium_andersonii.AAC.1
MEGTDHRIFGTATLCSGVRRAATSSKRGPGGDSIARVAPRLTCVSASIALAPTSTTGASCASIALLAPPRRAGGERCMWLRALLATTAAGVSV